MNISICNVQGEIIIRANGHNVYHSDYVENCVKYLEQTGAENIGGLWSTPLTALAPVWSLPSLPAHSELVILNSVLSQQKVTSTPFRSAHFAESFSIA